MTEHKPSHQRVVINGESFNIPIHYHNIPIKATTSKEAALEAEVERLQERLEITHEYNLKGEKVLIPPEKRNDFPDAVSCRDSTIELMEERVFKLEKALTTTRAASEFIVIAMRVMLEDVFKETEQALNQGDKDDDRN